MRIFLFLVVCLLAAGCRKTTHDEIFLKAQVQLIRNECSPVVLNFSEDSVAIRNLTGQQGLIWAPKELPEVYLKQDKKLYVRITNRGVASDVCTAVWIWYPRLKVLEVKTRD